MNVTAIVIDSVYVNCCSIQLAFFFFFFLSRNFAILSGKCPGILFQNVSEHFLQLPLPLDF